MKLNSSGKNKLRKQGENMRNAPVTNNHLLKSQGNAKENLTHTHTNLSPANSRGYMLRLQ